MFSMGSKIVGKVHRVIGFAEISISAFSVKKMICYFTVLKAQFIFYIPSIFKFDPQTSQQIYRKRG